MNLGRRTEGLLQMMSLYTVCEIVSDEVEGIRSFGNQPSLFSPSM
ncbi:MAG: hypothetical protein ABSH47_04560 [Bryobacteraceae bacterium]|jgi:hypothetical protein